MPCTSGRSSVLQALLLATILLPGAAFAAGPVSGRIVDSDGRPVPRARVLLVDGHLIAASTHAAVDGRFVLETRLEGPYVLRASAEGLRADPLPITVTGAAQDIGTVTLQLSAISESVVVSAAQVEVPLSAAGSAVTILTGEELQARQYESVADALRAVPGLTVSASGGRGALTAVFPRGGESDYTIVLIDGVQANSFGGGFDFAHLPVANIERIEVVRGPQSALHGANAIGAVVRIVTRRGGHPAVDGSIEGGSFGTLRMTGGTSGSAGPWQWSATGERLTTDNLNGALTAGGQTISNDAYARSTAAAGVGWRAPTGAVLRGDVRYAQDERGAPGPFGKDPGGTFGGIDERAFGTYARWLASLSASAPLGTRTRAQAHVAHGRTDGTFTDFFGADPFPSDTWSRRTTARVQVDRTITRSFETTAGAELLGERAGSTFIVAAASAVPVERSLAGFFAEGRWSREARIFVTGGVRAERIARDVLAADPSGFVPRPELPRDVVISINPKVAAAWYLRSSGGEFTRLRASAGTGIRPPDAFEIAFTDNPALRPERSRSADVGLDAAVAAGRLLLESTLFVNAYDDLIVAVGSFRESSRYRTDNISNARARGLELAGTVRARAGGGDLLVRTAYTLLGTEILAADGAAAAPSPFSVGDRLLRRPAHQLAVDAALTHGPWTGFVRGGGRSAVRDVDPSFGTFGGLHDAAGYTTWDAGLGWTVRAPAEIVLRVANIFDQKYEEALGYPALGRGLFLGLRIAARR